MLIGNTNMKCKICHNEMIIVDHLFEAKAYECVNILCPNEDLTITETNNIKSIRR